MQTRASFINVFFSSLYALDAMVLDQALVNFLIYHNIIGAHCECKQSSDFAQLVPKQ